MVGYLVGCLSIPRDSKNIDGVTVPVSNGGLPSWLFVVGILKTDSKNIDGVTVPASNGGLPSWLFVVGILKTDSKNIDGVTVPASNGGLPSWLFVVGILKTDSKNIDGVTVPASNGGLPSWLFVVGILKTDPAPHVEWNHFVQTRKDNFGRDVVESRFLPSLVLLFFKECQLYSNFNGDIFDDYIFT